MNDLKEIIYMDNGATTAMESQVLDAMKPYFLNEFGNSFGNYSLGTSSRMAVETARNEIAKLIGAGPGEIYFTSGGTESNNWVIKSICDSNRDGGRHIITSAVEHPAVLKSCEYLAKRGFEVTKLPVDSSGRISVDALAAALRDDTILVSIMMANNEIGTIEPIAAIGELLRKRGVLFHTDAVQGVGHLPINVKELKVDFLSASGHKFGGPKGVGFLYADKKYQLEPLNHGGGQERGLRGGTHNVAAIVGMGEAAKLAGINMAERAAYEIELRDYFVAAVLNEIEDSKINGCLEDRLPGNCNFVFPGASSESLLIKLDRDGICASAGSACASGALEVSHVLTAIGLDKGDATCSLRFSIDYRNTREEVDFVVKRLGEIVRELRRK